eukprot:4358287-Pleurochrysis_carterae.AAC.1
MFVMRVRRRRFREDVRYVVVRPNLAHLNASVRHVLSHLQVASVNMSRALAGVPFFPEFHCPRVVH